MTYFSDTPKNLSSASSYFYFKSNVYFCFCLSLKDKKALNSKQIFSLLPLFFRRINQTIWQLSGAILTHTVTVWMFLWHLLNYQSITNASRMMLSWKLRTYIVFEFLSSWIYLLVITTFVAIFTLRKTEILGQRDRKKKFMSYFEKLRLSILKSFERWCKKRMARKYKHDSHVMFLAENDLSKHV